MKVLFQKVCLINPPTSRERDPIFFPMGLTVLATILQKNNVPVEIVDFELLLRDIPDLRKNPKDFEAYALEKLRTVQAQIFGITSICSNFPIALSLAQLLRNHFPQSKIILGGPQPSAVPQKTLEYFPAVDAIVIGEGERTLLELLSTDFEPEAMASVAGIAFRNDQGVTTTAPRALIDDLDELPIPDFSILPLENYLAFTSDLALIEAGRGCPFRCTFCSTAEMWSRKYRAKSPGRILEEMRVLHKKFGINYFSLTHDNFTTSPKYVRRFCEYFIQHNEEGFTWNSSARTDTLKVDDLRTLHRAGCRALYFGVDSGSERIQKVIDKHLDLEEFKEIFEATLAQDIRPITSFVIGFPDERPEELDETILLGMWAKGRGAKEVQFHRLAPLASTKIFAENINNLQFHGVSSDMSFPPFYDEKMERLMAAHPALFSSFFEIPTPQLEPLNLLALANFYNVIGNRLGPALHWVFDKKKKRPTELFAEWTRYAQARYPGQAPTPNFIVETFSEFI